MSKILKEKKLIKLNKQITFIKAKIKLSRNYVVLDVEPDEFVGFCCSNRIATIFYDYEMYEKDKYLITDEMIKSTTSNTQAYNFCKQWADKENEKICSFDFSSPKRLTLAVSLGNTLIISTKENEWLPEDMEEGERALTTFQWDHEEELFEFEDDEVEGETVNPCDELKWILWNDKAFRNCHNKESIKIYLRDFLRKKENQKYLLLFKSEKERFEKEYRLELLFEQLFWEYARTCNKLKIETGKPIPEKVLDKIVNQEEILDEID